MNTGDMFPLSAIILYNLSMEFAASISIQLVLLYQSVLLVSTTLFDKRNKKKMQHKSLNPVVSPQTSAYKS